ncbi:DUF732 domain-containing protein [Pseudonocardia alni]|uniref:DUF732 domain-containing protein n=1 Tax=Pseudonocardia alni TaxID=33907 RepID=UPI0033E6AA3D
MTAPRLLLPLSAAVVVLVGCSGPADPPTAGEAFQVAVRSSLPGWTDPELITLGSIACSSSGSRYDRTVSLVAARSALEYGQAGAVVDAALTHLCPG